MATKQEITAAIREGIDQVDRTFGSLTDEQLQTKVHAGEGGWTTKEILAHLAGRAQGYELMRGLAAGKPFPGGFDVNSWNRERVAERIANSRDDLLTEFRAIHEDLLAYVASIDEATLATAIQLGPHPAPLSEVLRRSGGLHSSAHASEVEQALQAGA